LPAAATDADYLAGNAAALALLEKAAALPQCRWPRNWATAEPWNMLSPYYSQLRQGANLLAAKMRVEARAGAPDDALRTCGLALALPRTLQDEPTQIGPLVANSLLAIALEGGLRDALGLTQPPPPAAGPVAPAPPAPLPPLPSTPACQALFTQLGQVQLGDSLHRALPGDRAEGLDVFRWILQHPEEMKDIVGGQQARAYAGPQGKQVLALDEVMFLQLMADTIKAADQPWAQGRAAFTALEARHTALPRYCAITTVLMSEYSSVVQKRDRTRAQLARAQIALALIACHNQTGQWPATLDEVRKLVGWDLPLDPFSGKDFIYRQEGAGWILYSLGPDLKDDGGAAFPGPADKYGAPTGDLVWSRK
jgi:hypothetical protein